MTSEWAQLRQIMYEPSQCWLSTEYSGDRWLTDQYVLMNVSDHEGFEELADGPYKLTVSNGPQARDSVPEPDIEAWFAVVARYSWREVRPSEWSVAEHPGKAMLWVIDEPCPIFGEDNMAHLPCLLGEPTWTAISRHYPDVIVEYAPEGNLFRFSATNHIDPMDDCLDGGCACGPLPFCYAAGIRVPDGQEAVADAIANAA